MTHPAMPDQPPDTIVQGAETAPVSMISGPHLQALGARLDARFGRYKGERYFPEQRWTKAVRQDKGEYDPTVQFSEGQSQAYPRITRAKCERTESRMMNLMFPGNDVNWTVKPSPKPNVPPRVIEQLVTEEMRKRQEAGVDHRLTPKEADHLIARWAAEQAEALTALIEDQLQEIGGDQTRDWISLNQKVIRSGIKLGVGLLRGPMARETRQHGWQDGPNGPEPVETIVYKPMFEVLPVWDFYPDMAAKSLSQVDNYFIRHVMSSSQLRDLGRRSDFLEDRVKLALETHATGNYRELAFESELRAIGGGMGVSPINPDVHRYEVLQWHGRIAGKELVECGCPVPADRLEEDLEAEIWMVSGTIIKVALNPWAALAMSSPDTGVTTIKQLHVFEYQDDDGQLFPDGVPIGMRDSQMMISGGTRMLLDNAATVCRDSLEVNVDLMDDLQDVSAVVGGRVYSRTGMGIEAQYPAIRPIQMNAHLRELTDIVRLGMEFADLETFTPQTQDIERGQSESRRTQAGASMAQGSADLPFKNAVRKFDTFTQSVILSIEKFNRAMNADLMPEGDFNIIARGATSLVAKEVRGQQLDQLAATLTPEERVHIDERLFVEARLKVRDMTDVLLPLDEVDRRQKVSGQRAEEQEALAKEMAQAEIRKVLTDAVKNVAQAQKNSAGADSLATKNTIELLEAIVNSLDPSDTTGSEGSATGPKVPPAVGMAAMGLLTSRTQPSSTALPNPAGTPTLGGFAP